MAEMRIGKRCDKPHPALPDGYDVIRCRHGRIGATVYSVVEAANSTSPDEGIWIYADVPSRDVGYSLVCMANYHKIKEDIKKDLFNLFSAQLAGGLKPLFYVMKCKGGRILSIDHSEESLETAAEHSMRQGETGGIRSSAVLCGRIPLNEGLN